MRSTASRPRGLSSSTSTVQVTSTVAVLPKHLPPAEGGKQTTPTGSQITMQGRSRSRSPPGHQGGKGKGSEGKGSKGGKATYVGPKGGKGSEGKGGKGGEGKGEVQQQLGGEVQQGDEVQQLTRGEVQQQPEGEIQQGEEGYWESWSYNPSWPYTRTMDAQVENIANPCFEVPWQATYVGPSGATESNIPRSPPNLYCAKIVPNLLCPKLETYTGRQAGLSDPVILAQATWTILASRD